MFGIVELFYRPIFDLFGGDEFLISVFGTFIVTFSTIWIWSALFAIVDLYQWPKWMLKYKVQPGTNQPVNKAKLLKACKYAFVNTTIVNVSVAVILYPLQQIMGCSADPDKIPYFWTILRDMVVCNILNDIGFYYTHRLLHWGPLYRNVHKLHHEWTSPVAIVSQYAHPFEHLLASSFPFEIGPLLCGSHLCLVWFLSVFSSTAAVIHYSGYHVPFFDSPEYQDFHYLKFNVNYGGSGWLDTFHGTDYPWTGSIQEKRHFSFYSLTKSIRDYIPDKKDEGFMEDYNEDDKKRN